jgi:seryl-tRNA synthetase
MKNLNKKIITICLVFTSSILFTSCESTSDVQNDIERLKMERVQIQKEINELSSSKSSVEKEISSLSEKLKELHILHSGKTPHHILKIKLKQSRISLDIEEHIKDAMNAIDFEIPVDKDFYNRVHIGTNITDKFRVGSFVLNGSFSNWNMTVIEKHIN